ncbi:MAG: hypothetical protein ACOZQL_24280 [Myxococcota bacterium]
MTSHLWLNQPMATPAPAEIAAYLRSKGWSRESVRGAWAIFKKGDDAIEVPQVDAARDYSRMVSALLQDLEQTEARPAALIARDIRAATVDTIRLSLQGSAMRDGRIPIEAGMHAYEGARNLFLAAACSSLDRRSVHPKRKPDRAVRVLDTARFGQTEVGSFVMTIETPVAPSLQASLLEEDRDPPLERQTSVLLATALQATSEAIQESAATGDIAPFRDRADRGVSANLCDALVELLSGAGAEQLEASFSFATHRPISAPSTRTVLRTEVSPLLTEASKTLRAQASFPDYTVEGLIVRLGSGEPSEGGHITVMADVEGRTRNVTIEVDASDYAQALHAHQRQQLVSLSGELTVEAGRYRLRRARDFRARDVD